MEQTENQTYADLLKAEREKTPAGKDPYRSPTEVLADKIGISTFTLQRWIQGTEPKQKRVIKAAAVYFAGRDL